ncbi:class I SAM-dependent methyltransferase [Yoonia sp.]|uniref:class I SAM-dependent methyltransferase n=1 Tax=Yoonia sp. TaxID=2212373 RepID=UPI00358F23F8
MSLSNTNQHYDSDYFEWQKNIGIFGGKANSFKFKRSISSEDAVIDFGCGGGFLLANLDCANRMGIEVNDYAHQQITDNGVSAYNSPQAVSDIQGEECADVIISNHALEHTLNPLLELKSLYPLLKKGGKIHFVVPCDSISYSWKPKDINFHLYSWSPMNLGNLFTEAGFQVVEVKPYIHKWPPFYRKIQKIFGWTIFNVLCRFWGRIERSWYQVEIVAMK